MTDFRSAVLLNRYIAETRTRREAQEERVLKFQLAGVQDDGDAQRLLDTLRGALAALELRAARLRAPR
ncbi:hypothetical protein [Cupriavidus pauculus]|uniref:hypothetical protein n=1 Tax=Cupriavidus pauculus TaxID=82633 RepID=UPI0012FD6D31|nr:hypothetical protein [Cupriavidus pauculus]